jgi:hypothetical protein
MLNGDRPDRSDNRLGGNYCIANILLNPSERDKSISKEAVTLARSISLFFDAREGTGG